MKINQVPPLRDFLPVVMKQFPFSQHHQQICTTKIWKKL